MKVRATCRKGSEGAVAGIMMQHGFRKMGKRASFELGDCEVVFTLLATKKEETEIRVDIHKFNNAFMLGVAPKIRKTMNMMLEEVK